jgi:hypothetical protein
MDVTVYPEVIPQPTPPRRVRMDLSEDEFEVLRRLVFDRGPTGVGEDVGGGAFAWLDDQERSSFRQNNDFIYKLSETAASLRRTRGA